MINSANDDDAQYRFAPVAVDCSIRKRRPSQRRIRHSNGARGKNRTGSNMKIMKIRLAVSFSSSFVLCISFLRGSGQSLDRSADYAERPCLTATQLGIAFSAFAYPYAFFQIAGGWLGDRMGPRVTWAFAR